MFFVIHNSDGDTRVEMLLKDELLRRLNERYYGDTPRFCEKMPDSIDTNYWPEHTVLIIRGGLVAPTPQEVALRYTFD